ncbi:hypothetical protein HMN09_00565300 [Mycena chlorophos]|uniref:Transmembrane protein n=1 Tax=Mycena chlorophos TaxID=658473 RepID=A0A8H6TAF5_MYCCL|nr:hypothetical protein HMN09_00565300 [Mycena chlorophos]
MISVLSHLRVFSFRPRCQLSSSNANTTTTTIGFEALWPPSLLKSGLSPPAMSTTSKLDTVTGALLVGSWASCLLYACELVLVFLYFRSHSRDDPWLLKALVSFVCLLDTASAAAICVNVYLDVVTHALDPAFLSRQLWTTPLIIFSLAFVAILVQGFLVFRYRRLTKNNLVTLVLVLFILLAAAACFIIGVFLIKNPALVGDDPRLRVVAILWVVSEAATNITVPFALLWEFRAVRTLFRDFRNAADGVIAQAVQTGLGGAVLAVAAMVTAVKGHLNNVPLGIACCLGRMYVITLLSNLIARPPSTFDESAAINGIRASFSRAVDLSDAAPAELFRTTVIHADPRPPSIEHKRRRKNRDTHRPSTGGSNNSTSRPGSSRSLKSALSVLGLGPRTGKPAAGGSGSGNKLVTPSVPASLQVHRVSSVPLDVDLEVDLEVGLSSPTEEDHDSEAKKSAWTL